MTTDPLQLALQHYHAGRLADAETLCYQLLVQQSQHAGALHLLGVIAGELQRPQQALDLINQAITVCPTNASYYCDLGVTCERLRLSPEAVSAYQKSLALDPNYFRALKNLGFVLRRLNQFDQAIPILRRAADLQPNDADLHANLGGVFLALENIDDALPCLHRALALNPEHAPAHYLHGYAMKLLGRVDACITAYRRYLALQPANLTLHSDLLHLCIFHPDYDARTIYQENLHWYERHATLTQNIPPHPNDRSPNRRLRIGYVSPDFRLHCQTSFTTPLLSHHDHQQFEVFCYSHVLAPDPFTAALQPHADVWRNTLGLSDEQYADLIRQDQIDILIDLTMHMDNGRPLLFARKPAPIQVAWLAYPGTTGLPTIDYRLTDPYLDPPLSPPGMDESVYTEKTFRLPDSFWCYDPLALGPSPPPPPINTLPAQSNGYISFGCLNKILKVNDPVLHLWARVLNAIPRSILFLLSGPRAYRQHVLDVLQQHGIAPDRIVFATPAPRSEYLALYHAIDLGIDCLPANGHTTSLDSYWMGVPVITLVGNTVVGRAGLSQLTNLNLTDLIAHTPDQFVQITTTLANDLPRLAQLRSTLRQRMQQSPLMDAPRFARAIESAYRQMWHHYCKSPSTAGAPDGNPGHSQPP